jgi:hypothetical protein
MDCQFRDASSLGVMGIQRQHGHVEDSSEGIASGQIANVARTSPIGSHPRIFTDIHG